MGQADPFCEIKSISRDGENYAVISLHFDKNQDPSKLFYNFLFSYFAPDVKRVTSKYYGEIVEDWTRLKPGFQFNGEGSLVCLLGVDENGSGKEFAVVETQKPSKNIDIIIDKEAIKNTFNKTDWQAREYLSGFANFLRNGRDGNGQYSNKL